MIEWITILALIGLGIFLVIAEIVFIPGIFVAGSIGVLFSIYGTYLSYDYFGNAVGSIVLVSTVIGNILAVVFTLRGKSWDRFSLKQTSRSRVNEDYGNNLQPGDIGTTTSSLKPFGKALFDDNLVEVRSKGNFIEENVEIKILRIESGKIFVEPNIK